MIDTDDEKEIINFEQLNEECNILIKSQNVVIISNSGTLEDDSKFEYDDYKWLDRYTSGNLSCYHPHTCLMAKVEPYEDHYRIRILNKENSAQCVKKYFTDEIADISFSKTEIPYLALIDINRRVTVYKVNINEGVIENKLIVNIKADPPIESVRSMEVSYWGETNNRVMWYSPKDTGTNQSLLLGVVYGPTAEVLEIYKIEKHFHELYKTTWQDKPTIDRFGLIKITQRFQEEFSYRCSPDRGWSDVFLPYIVYTSPEDNSRITSLTISDSYGSDAAVLAVEFRFGEFRYFTFNSKSTSGLNFERRYSPFGNDAVWSILFFEDSRADSLSNRRYLVVGSRRNSEIKLFRCWDKWDCLQTISFESSVTPCVLSAHIGQSGRYLLMSDIREKLLYVLELDSKDNNEPKLFTNVQRFALTKPIPSLDIPEEGGTEDDNAFDIAVRGFITTGLQRTFSSPVVINETEHEESLEESSIENDEHNTSGIP